jgi:DNA helicase-2/ATP-dependent DNA helicase PcrA
LGGQSFFDRREIRDLLAYLKVMAQPQDEISLLRIINVPARGIGATTTEKLLKRAVQERISLWQAIPLASAAGEVSAKAGAALETFRQLLDRYRARFQEQPRLMGQLLANLIEEIDYEGEIEKQYKEPQQQLIRSAMVEQCVDALREYAERSPEPTLLGFLEDSALTGQDEDRKDDDMSKEKGIRLMTLHSAKGLEFPHVYLIGMEEGLLPHQRAVDSNESAIAEERRLAYVGITRAMDHLTLSRAANRTKWGKRRPSNPSRFLFEMR